MKKGWIKKISRGFLIVFLLSLAVNVITALPVFAQGTTPSTAQTVSGPLKCGPYAGNSTDTSWSNGADIINATNILDSSGPFCWVTIIWNYMRQFTNIAVVIFLFMMSVATTLNYNLGTYGIKRLLPGLITATLLANFSMTVAKIFLNINEGIKNGLLQLGGGEADVTDPSQWSAIGQLGYPVRLMANEYINNVDAKWGALFIAMIAWVAFVVLLIGIAFLALMVYVRNYFLALLVALAPLAFITMANPLTQSVFKKWWDNFIKWMFFPTVVAFWLGLAALLGGVAAVGGIPALALMFILTYAAIKTPFSMGPAVAAAAGFVAGNTWGKIRPGLQNAAGQNAQILLQRTPGVGNTMRYFTENAKRRSAVLEGLRKRPVVKSSNVNIQRTLEGRKGLSRYTTAALLAGPLVRNWLAQKYERRGIHAERVSKDAETVAKETRVSSMTDKEERLDADRELRAKAADGLLERHKLEAELEYRENNRGLSMQLAENEEAVDSIKENLQGIGDKFKAMALSANEELRNMRRLASARKEMSSVFYNNALSNIKLEARQANGPYSQALETELQNDLDDLLGKGYAPGPSGTRLRSAIALASGEKQRVEGAIESLTKTEKLLDNEGYLAAQSSIAEGLQQMNLSHLVNHTYGMDQNGRAQFKQALGNGLANPLMQQALTEMGVGHLSPDEQVERLQTFLHAGSREMRSANAINSQKEIGAAESGQVSFMAKDASMQTAIDLAGNDVKNARLAMDVLSAGGIHTNAGSVIYNTQFGATSRDRRSNLDSASKAFGRMKGFVQRFTNASSSQDLVDLWRGGRNQDWYNTVQYGYLRGRNSMDNVPVDTLPIGEFNDPGGTPMRHTIGDLMKYLSNPGSYKLTDNSAGQNPINEDRVVRAVRSALSTHLHNHLHLDRTMSDMEYRQL